MSSANEALDAARANKTSALREIDSSVNELTTVKNEAKRKINSSASDLELEELKEKKKDAVLKAETDGELRRLTCMSDQKRVVKWQKYRRRMT